MKQTHLQYFYIACLTLAMLFLPSCKTVKLKDAERADRLGEYALAADMYNTLFKRAKRSQIEMKGYLAFHSAENYRRMGHQPKALRGYLSAKRFAYPDSIVDLRIAQSYHQGGQYKEAIKRYQAYLEAFPGDYFATQGLKGCQMAIEAKEQPTRFKLTRANNWNSARGDFGAAYTPDGSAIFFTSSRSKNPEVEESNITGLKPNDIYVIKKDAAGKWQRPDSISGGLNTDADEGVLSISPDGNTLYYTYAEHHELYDRTAQIYEASRSGEGGWLKGSLVNLMGDSLRLAAHPSISASGEYIYFVSDIGGGMGGKDIYRARISERSYGSPENLGAQINTPGDEMYPFIEGDSTLYFASNGHAGFGGLDIFKAKLDTLGEWSVTHMGAPINSQADDFNFVVAPKPKDQDLGFGAMQGIMASSRGDLRGYPHLFLFDLPGIITEIQGYVLDREENPIPNATVRIVGERGPVGQGFVSTRNDGSYHMRVQGDTRYVMLAGADKYLNQYVELKTDTAAISETYYVNFFLASRERAEGLQNIFYDFDKATLRPESMASLDELLKILADNPEVFIELASHADRRGPDAYNLRLSDRRAESVVNYLVSKGVEPQRLSFKGYGKSQPKVVSTRLAEKYEFLQPNDTLSEKFIVALPLEEQQEICDQLNRRTEFRVIEADEAMRLMEEAAERERAAEAAAKAAEQAAKPKEDDAPKPEEKAELTPKENSNVAGKAAAADSLARPGRESVVPKPKGKADSTLVK